MPDHAAYCKRTAVAAAIAAAFPGTLLGASVARVDFAVGNVTAVAPDGRSRPLSRGSEIDVGDMVATRQGRAQLRFTDGARMSLQPGTEFKVDEYQFAGKADGDENIVMSLLKGGMRTITGLIGRINRDKYKLRTEVATIGIRGTEYSVSYTNSINVFCALGSIAVINDAGTLVLNSGEGGFVSNINTQPARTEERPELPAPPPAVNPPPNPFQDPSQTQTQTQTQAVLTGTFSGNWAAVATEVSDGSVVIGPKRRADKSVTLDSNGALVEFEGSVNKLGTATALSDGNDGIIAWGRWINGTTLGDGDFAGIDLANGLHYVVGMPAGVLPTGGVATYDMIGHSASCFGGSCTSMVVNSSTLSVDFGASSVGMNMNFNVNGDYAGNYTFTSSGYAENLNGAEISSLSGYLSGPSSGSLSAKGILAGEGGSRAGMAWTGQIYGSSPTTLTGVTAYKKQ